MTLQYKIFLESRVALGVTGAGHMYLVKRQVDVAADGSYSNVANGNERVIQGTIGFPGLLTGEQLLQDSTDYYGATDTPQIRHSVDITALIVANSGAGGADAAWAVMTAFATVTLPPIGTRL